ncbi:MAG TPA: beta-N-acetylhexosaminidase [Gammaproteobacteria bacterium]|nr:beta-N-acetylhexosaminidase [Gammaproteobacteria bacterium]
MLMIDIKGTELTPEDKKLLKNPKVGGIILFTRNYESLEQLIHLTNEIHALRTPPLMIAVDHEGGRVQRFREGFTQLPPMRELGNLYDTDPKAALEKSENIGFIMASELRAAGVDCSFAPILDIDAGLSAVIGNRSFHHDPEVIIKLAGALIKGMKRAGLITVGKHFPGHGHVEADSHIAIPVDHRTLEEIDKKDILPFKSLINMGLDGIMPAHVIYEKIDKNPAGFSVFWLQTILRKKLDFKGLIFSDDLSMEGASPMGNMIERVAKAKAAGCDMILICNNRPAAIEVIEHDHS